MSNRRTVLPTVCILFLFINNSHHSKYSSIQPLPNVLHAFCYSNSRNSPTVRPFHPTSQSHTRYFGRLPEYYVFVGNVRLFQPVRHHIRGTSSCCCIIAQPPPTSLLPPFVCTAVSSHQTRCFYYVCHTAPPHRLSLNRLAPFRSFIPYSMTLVRALYAVITRRSFSRQQSAP